jgi:hypothetical protein
MALWMLPTLVFCSSIFLLASSSVETGFVYIDDNANVAISSPEGRVLVNGVDVLSAVSQMMSRIQELESIVAQVTVLLHFTFVFS